MIKYAQNNSDRYLKMLLGLIYSIVIVQLIRKVVLIYRSFLSQISNAKVVPKSITNINFRDF